MTALQGPSRERLGNEIAEFESEIDASGDDEDDGGIAWIRQDTLASHKLRLARLDQLHVRADQLLHLAGRCEALAPHYSNRDCCHQGWRIGERRRLGCRGPSRDRT